MSSKYFIKELWDYGTIADVVKDDETLNELYNAGGFQKDKLRMVGIFWTNNNDIVYCCPKYISDEQVDSANEGNEPSVSELQKHMSLIVKVLEKLRANDKNIDEISYEFSVFKMNARKRKVNRYNLAKSIVTDYLENGIYFCSEKEIKQTGRGKIRWGLTMRKIKPVISNDEVFYPSLLRQTDYKNYNEEITEIHKNIVFQCIEYLQQLGENTSIEKPNIVNRINQSNMYKCTPYIKQCLLSAYTNREILLFKAMISWCDASPFYKGMGCTTCFQNVWEWVNDSVWGTHHKSSLKSSVPKYYFGEKTYDGSGNQEPDTLAFVEDENEKHLVLFDSKYYVPKDKITNSTKSIIGLPSSNDLVKQIAYINDIKDACGDGKNIIYSNIFLLPDCDKYSNGENGDERIWKMIGLSSKGNFEELCKFLNIQNNSSTNISDYVGIALVSPDKLYQQYLINGRLGLGEISAISKKYNELQLNRG